MVNMIDNSHGLGLVHRCTPAPSGMLRALPTHVMIVDAAPSMHTLKNTCFGL